MSALRRQRAQRWLAALLAVAAFSVACSEATPTATATTNPTEPTVVALATTEPVDTPAPAATPTPTATAAPAPAPTPEPTPTSEPTSEPTPEPTPEPTATPPPSADAALAEALAASSLELVQCPADVAAAQVTCAVATVPLDAAQPATGDTVTIMTALVDNGDPNGVGPVVFLQGGPGIGSVTSAKLFVGGSHDVLFVDPRGTGYSTPKLNCPEVDALWVGQFSNDPAQRIDDVDTARIEAYQQCGARLQAQGVPFDEFNTSSTATDFELVRQLFGYDTWSLWGISYGTRLGLTLMREYPTGIRAAVLDSVVPFEVDFFATLPENAFRSMAALDQACNIVQCAENHGDFLENLAALTQKLEQEPVVVSATRPVSGATFPFVVGGAEVIDMVFIQLYSTRALRALPRQVGRAEFGGLDELVASYVARRDPERVDLSVAMYYTTWCREEFPFFDSSTDDDFLATTGADFGDAFAQTLSSDGLQQICDIFSVAPAEPIDDQPLASDIPTVVFAGAFDPITPPQWSRQVADALTNATFVQLADHGHGMSSQCPASIRLAFLIAPDTPPNIECAQTATAPNFE